MTAKTPRTYLLATVLLIGDSHTYQSFGRNLDTLLRSQADTQVATRASWGTHPASWFLPGPATPAYFEANPDGTTLDLPAAPTPDLGALLEKFRPQLTIVALGANLYGAPMEYSASTVQRLAAMIAASGSDCLWVGPPDSRDRKGPRMDELYGVLRGASTPYCRFLDSRSWTRYPATGGDGVHYDYLGADGLEQTRVWARKVYEIGQIHK